MTDSIPKKQLYSIFRRLEAHVKSKGILNNRAVLEGKTTPEKLYKQRMKRTIDLQRRAIENAKKPSTVRKWRGKRNRLKTLYREGFLEAFVGEAKENSDGLIGLTMVYGIQKADKILLARARERMGRLQPVKGSRRTRELPKFRGSR